MNRKAIKLLYLINSFDVGGAEKAMVRLLSSIDREKYDIQVVAITKGSGRLLGEVEELGIPVKILGVQHKTEFYKLLRLIQVIRSYNAELLVCSLFHSTVLGRIFGSLLRVPVIVNWEHNENLGGAVRKFINGITCPLTDKVICDSKAVEKVVNAKMRLCRAKTVVVSIGGIDINQFDLPKRKEIGVVNIGSVGRLLKQKGYDLLLLAIKKVLENHQDIQVTIVGGGPEREVLIDLRDKLGLTEQVHFLGFRDDVPDLLASWDMYVQPSRWEGLCITVIEAMASGLPVVATNVGGIPESVVDGESGLLIPPVDVGALAEKIDMLIENPELRKKMGSAGRKMVGKKYSLTTMVSRFESVLDDLIKEKLGLFYNHSSGGWETH